MRRSGLVLAMAGLMASGAGLEIGPAPEVVRGLAGNGGGGLRRPARRGRPG